MLDKAREAVEELDEALAGVGQLTELSLELSAMDQLPCLPQQLSGLHHLRRFSWRSAVPAATELPTGWPWLPRLRRLVLPVALAAATQLEHLGVCRLKPDGAQHVAALLEVAAAHPALLRVTVEAEELAAFQGAIRQARQRKLALRVDAAPSAWVVECTVMQDSYVWRPWPGCGAHAEGEPGFQFGS